MPFHSYLPHSLNASSIRTYAPASSGVYGISNGREWLYIGETHDIQDQLLAHLRDVTSLLNARKPTGFVFEVCSAADRLGRQDRLVSEYEPICNRHWTRMPRE
jgi:hypothetical protein